MKRTARYSSSSTSAASASFGILQTRSLFTSSPRSLTQTCIQTQRQDIHPKLNRAPSSSLKLGSNRTYSSPLLFVASVRCHRGHYHTTRALRRSSSASENKSHVSSTRQLFRYLKEMAEAGDREAQFKIGCMLCLGEDALRSPKHPAEGMDEEDSSAAALIQLEQLDFILSDDGSVIPKEKETFEKTQITNFKQWIKREREKLKNAWTERSHDRAEQDSEEDNIAVDYPQAAKWFELSAKQNHSLAQYFVCPPPSLIAHGARR